MVSFCFASLWTSPADLHKLAKKERYQYFPSTDLSLVQKRLSTKHSELEKRQQTGEEEEEEEEEGEEEEEEEEKLLL